MSGKNPYDVVEETIMSCLEELKKIKSKKSDKGGQVWLGRSESISSFFERKFAEKLSELYPNFIFLVDYPIRLQKESKSIRSQNIYPDIIIFDKDSKKIKGIIEIKTDVGYFHLEEEEEKAEKDSYKYKQLNEADAVKFNKFVGKYDKKPKEEINLKLDNSAKKIFLIVTEKNAHGKGKILQIEKFMKNFGFETISLLRDSHYNDDAHVESSSKLLKDLKQKEQEINFLFKF